MDDGTNVFGDTERCWDSRWMGEGSEPHRQLDMVPAVGWSLDRLSRPGECILLLERDNLTDAHLDSPIVLSRGECSNGAVRRYLDALARLRGRQIKVAAKRLWPKPDPSPDLRRGAAFLSLLDAAESDFGKAGVAMTDGVGQTPDLSDMRWWELAALATIVLHNVEPRRLDLPGCIAPVRSDFCLPNSPPIEYVTLIPERVQRWEAIGLHVALLMANAWNPVYNGPAQRTVPCMENCACTRPNLLWFDRDAKAPLGPEGATSEQIDRWLTQQQLICEGHDLALRHRKRAEEFAALSVRQEAEQVDMELRDESLRHASCAHHAELLAFGATKLALMPDDELPESQRILNTLEHLQWVIRSHPRKYGASLLPTHATSLTLRNAGRLKNSLGQDGETFFGLADASETTSPPSPAIWQKLDPARMQLADLVKVRAEAERASTEWVNASDAVEESGLDADSIRKRAEKEEWDTIKEGRWNCYRRIDLHQTWPSKFAAPKNVSRLSGKLSGT